MFRYLLLSTLVSLALLGARAADVLELKDGSVLNGRFLGATADTMRFEVFGQAMEFPQSNVLALTMGGAPEPAPAVPAAPATPPPPPAVAPAGPVAVTVPAGTLLLVRMRDTVTTRNSAGRRFSAELDSDLRVGGQLVAPRGARVWGRVEEARQARRMTGASQIEVGLIEIEIGGQRVPIITSDVRIRTGNATGDTAIRTGVGAGIGAAFDGGRGAGRGAAIGAGTAALGRSEAAQIRKGELLEFTLLEPFTATVR